MPDYPNDSVPAVDTTMAALELAAGDGGCALTHRVLADPYLKAGRLVTPLDREFTDEHSYFICMPQRRDHCRRQVDLFREWLIEIASAA